MLEMLAVTVYLLQLLRSKSNYEEDWLVLPELPQTEWLTVAYEPRTLLYFVA